MLGGIVFFKKIAVGFLALAAIQVTANAAHAEDIDTGDSFTPQAVCPDKEPSDFRPELKQGHYGMTVEYLQSLLGTTRQDGCFGPATRTAVINYQTRKGLIADGIVGEQCTWPSLHGEPVPSFCLARSNAPASDSEQTAYIVIDQWKEVVRLKSGSDTIDSMPMIDNHFALSKGEYTVCGFGRKVGDNYSRNGLSKNLAWVLPNFVRLCDSSGSNTGQGFHAIPLDVKTGVPMHDDSYLGTGKKQSSGCIRLSLADSQILWDFANKGMTVLVV